MKNWEDLVIDEETWRAIGDPATVELIARSLFVIKRAVDSGGAQAREASRVLSASIESAYLHTDAHRAALRLYLLSLTGHLKPQDEPLELINAAIERAEAQIKLAGKGKAGEKRRRGARRV